MIIISHRGNLEGPNPEMENTIPQIQKAIDLGFDVEMDLYFFGKTWFLGHDIRTMKEIKTDELVWLFLTLHTRLWIHAKNVYALEELSSKFSLVNYFYHNNDEATITSKGNIWTYPGITLRKGIEVVKEEFLSSSQFIRLSGVCTDYPISVSNQLKSKTI